VVSWSVDYWIPPASEFIAHLCCHLSTSDLIWRELQELDPGDPKQFRRYRALTVMASRESRMTSLLLTKLRLLPPQNAAATPTGGRRLPCQSIS
jgi:hypothetical protein